MIMRDDKKIEEAATIASISDTEKGHVKNGYVVSALADHENGYREGYIEGARWAINEFIKDLWHHASEIPSEGKHLILEYSITDTIKDYVSLKRLDNNYIYWDWASYFESANVTRWLYVDELFPKEGGEQ